MSLFWLAVAAVAGAYQFVALLASLRMARLRTPDRAFAPSVSVLKPVRAGDAPDPEAVRTNQDQDYPGQFEILWGSATTVTPNRKVGCLIDLLGRASGDVIVIADADIRPPRDYLRRVVAPLEDPRVGLVTCAYRAVGAGWPARFEALGVATDFAPSTFVAPFVGVDEFALGATIVVRRSDLERIGGLAAVADYLADDYQLGHRIHALGLRCVLSEVVVETRLGGETWRDVWRHQVRWARTIRISRPGGYAGLPVTHATLWALLAAAAGQWPAAFGLIAVRYAMAFAAGWYVLRSADVLRLWWAIPLRDVWGTAVWAAGLFGRTVEWGGERLRLDGGGRIVGRE